MTSSSPLPDFYAHVLVFGGNAPAGRPHHTARIGGLLRNPRISFSYLLSARRLIDQAGETGLGLDVVAFPIAYLQRHAFEVALKDFIAAAHEIEHSRLWVKQLERRGRGAVVPPRRSEPKAHAFPELLKILRNAIRAIGFDPADLPPEMDTMAQRLGAIEQHEHTRFRYGTFEKPVVLELGKVQADLEALFQQHLWFRDWDDAVGRGSLYVALAMEHEELFQVYASLEHELGLTTPVTDLKDRL